MRYFSLKGYATGYFQSCAVGVFLSDRYGSLDAYIEHLREPGMWMNIPTWIPVTFFVLTLVYFIVLSVQESGGDN